MKIVIDTSIYIEFLRTGGGVFVNLVNLTKRGRASIYSPSIVVLELRVGRSYKNRQVQDKVKMVLNPIKIVDLTRQIAERAGDLVREGKIVENEDAIIAATALYLDAELATLNKKHFEKVPNLKIYNSKVKIKSEKK